MVVGGSSGAGRAIAERLAADGHDVLCLQRRQAPGLPSMKLDLRESFDTVKQTVEAAAAGFEATCIIIAGGVGAFTHPLMRAEQLDEMVSTNFTGAVAVAQGALRYHLGHRRGQETRVLYLGSVSERNPAKGIEVYAATKAAASKYMIELGRRCARKGFLVNVLRTGWFDSPMTAGILPDLWTRIVDRIPVKRAARAEEVADMAIALLSAPSYYCANSCEMSGGL